MPELTKEEEQNFKKAFQQNAKIPQSKADVQLEKPEVKMSEENISPFQSLLLGGSNILSAGESFVAPKVLQYLYKKQTGIDMSEEEAQNASRKLYEKSQEKNPIAYGTGVAAREIGLGSGISKAAQTLKNIPSIASTAQKYAEPALYGGANALKSAIEGGDSGDIAMSGLVGAGMSKAPEAIAALPQKAADTARSAARFFTGTTKPLADFIQKNPEIAKQITKKGYPSSQELIQEQISQKKPMIEQMRLFKDAELNKQEAINHLLEEGYQYDPLKLASKIEEKIKDIPISSKSSEAIKKELNSHVNFYKKTFQDEDGNIIPMDGKQISSAIKDFQDMASRAYKEGTSPEITKIYRQIAADLRAEVGSDVPGFDKYMKQSERLVNRGKFIKKSVSEPGSGINWQTASEQEIAGSPVSESKLQSLLFDRSNKKVGMSMERDRNLQRLNTILPQGGKITPEDLLRVEGRKLMENPTNVGSGSAPILTGAPIGMLTSALAHSQGLDYLSSNALGTTVGVLAGQKIRQEGPAIATKAYMNIQRAEEGAKKFAQNSSNLVEKMIGTKYQKILVDALRNGAKSFASTVFTLKSTDPEFRQKYNEINGLDK